MLTPRRFLLFILALGGFAVTYFAYNSVLGGVDGLPALPVRYLTEASGQPIIINPTVPPIDVWLQKAFGPGAHEVTDTEKTYKTRFRKRDTGLAVACGRVDPDGTKFVTVAPISVALFGRPSTQPKPGEEQDISTFHADKAILEFDQEVSSLQELNGKATLVGIKMIADADLETNMADPRRGRIWITNNQKSSDPADLLQIRTLGPVFYEVPPDNKPYDPEVAQVWTAAQIEVFDRKTLPRPLHDSTLNVALARPDDLRKQGAVSDILHGLTLPPPTVVADGLKLYLLPEKTNKRGGVGYSGVRELRLCEKVQMNLWMEGGAGFPGVNNTKPDAAAKAGAEAAPPEDPKVFTFRQNPPIAFTGVFGSGLDGIAIAERMQRKSLLLVETPGSFRYDLENATAIFDVAPHAPQTGPNLVTVTRLTANDLSDSLFCSNLRLDLNRPDGKDPKETSKDAKGGGSLGDSRDGGMSIRKLTATGQQVYISVTSEQFTAQGTELIHEQDPITKVTTTTLVGSPVFADRENSQLRAGTADISARVEILSTDAPAGSKSARQSTVTVKGPGRIEMFDREQNRSTGQASWGTQLIHEKVMLGKQELDRLTFDGGGTFADTEGDVRLTADKLRLWLSERTTPDAKPANPDAKPATARGGPPAMLPHSLIGEGNVDAKSPDMIVRNTDKLTVWFRDIAPPKFETAPAPGDTKVSALKPEQPDPVNPPGNGPSTELKATEEPKLALDPKKLGEPKKFNDLKDPSEPKLGGDPKVAANPKAGAKGNGEPPPPPPNPIHVSARIVESWVTRYPLPTVPVVAEKPAALAPGAAPAKGPAAPVRAGPPGQSGMKYELERARCEDRVIVHQDPDPTDPAKPATGLDIVSSRLNLDHSPKGGLLTVTGPESDPAEVTFEDTKIIGPTVVIDQPNNSVKVMGRGKLRMLGGSDFAGAGDSSKASNMEVTWSNEMRFQGAKAFAEFIGEVVATQLSLPDPPGKARVGAAPGKGGNDNRELLPQPKDLGEPNPYISRGTLLGHRLDLTFDRPVYFNQTRASERNRSSNDSKTSSRPKLRSATVTPIPDDEIRQAGGKVLKEVMFIEEVFDPARKNQYVRARVLRASQIDFAAREKDQFLDASGPGELRLLQPPESNTTTTKPSAPEKPKDKDAEGDIKLTVVKFYNRMTARDTGGVYREAKFHGYSTTIQAPIKDPVKELTLDVRPDLMPRGSSLLQCDELLTVSSSQPTKESKVTQRMTAQGNAKFRNKDYEGLGGVITDDGEKLIFDGTPQRPAQIFGRKSGVNDKQSHTAEQIQYRKDGSGITVHGASSGTILNPGK